MLDPAILLHLHPQQTEQDETPYFAAVTTLRRDARGVPPRANGAPKMGACPTGVAAQSVGASGLQDRRLK
jgi:hypothetical protein